MFTAGCTIGILSLGAAFISQISGLVNLSDRLTLSPSATFFLGLASILLLHIGSFFIDAAMTHPVLVRRRFISRFGAELGMRLKSILRLAVYFMGFPQLLRIWGLFASAGQAAEKLLEYRISLGSLSLSIGIVASALLVIYFSRSISWFVRSILESEVFPRKNMDSGAGAAISKLTNYTLVLFGFVIALNLVGIELKNFIVLGGALGIGLGFGLQNIVNNFLSGLILLFERPVRVGDMIMVDNERGRVQKIGLRSTIIETLERSELIVPNSHFISQTVINWTLSNTVARLKIEVGVAYGSNIEVVLSVLEEIARANPKVMPDPAPGAFLVKFGQSSLDFELHVWLADVNEKLSTQSKISRQIAERFSDLGIEIAFPQMDVHLRTIQKESADVTIEKGENVLVSAKSQ
jgi:small-conductance mechanosensitive channel